MVHYIQNNISQKTDLFNNTSLSVYDPEKISVCFFNTMPIMPEKKCLVQLTEKCNYSCKHCFLSANEEGSQIDISIIKDIIVPFFISNKVTKVTLTGGEPLVHKDIIEIINEFTRNGIRVTVCTNGYLITNHLLKCIHNDLVKFNVSMHGFTDKSYDAFHGNKNEKLFSTVKNNLILLSNFHMLKGVLVTPNSLATISEYINLCKFCKSLDARYVLFNPLSEFGRGTLSKSLKYPMEMLVKLRLETESLIDSNFKIIYVRFPGNYKDSTVCCYKHFLYLFTNGDISICPYLIFGTSNDCSKYDREQFVLGNIFSLEKSLDTLLENYTLPEAEYMDQEICAKGCLAVKIANGQYIDDWDLEIKSYL